ETPRTNPGITAGQAPGQTASQVEQQSQADSSQTDAAQTDAAQTNQAGAQPSSSLTSSADNAGGQQPPAVAVDPLAPAGADASENEEPAQSSASAQDAEEPAQSSSVEALPPDGGADS